MQEQRAPGRARRTWFTFDVVFPAASALLLFLIGLFLHLRFYPIGNLGVETDFYGDVAVAARKLAEGRFSVLDYPFKGPLYPLLLAGVHALAGDWYRSGVLINLLCAGGSLILIYRLVVKMFHRPVAALTTCLVGVTGAFFIDGHRATTDHLFLVLSLGAMNLLLRPRRSARCLVAAGAVSALAILTRSNAAFLPIAAIPTLLWVDPEGRTGRERVRALGLYLGAFLLVWSPWLIINLAQTGRLSSSQNVVNLTLEYYRDPEVPNRPTRDFHSIEALVAHDPGHFAGHFLLNLVKYLRMDLLDLIGPVGAVLVVLGAVRLGRRRFPRRLRAFYLFPAVYFVSLALVFYLLRFRLLLEPAYAATAFAFLFGAGGEAESAVRMAEGVRPVPSADEGTVTSAGLETADGIRPAEPAPENASTQGRHAVRSSAPPRRSSSRLDPARRWLDRSYRLVPGGRTTLAVVVSALLLVPQIFNTIRFERLYLADRPLYMLDAAAFLKRHDPDPDGAVLMALKPHLPFLAGMRYQGYPWEVHGYGDFLAFIRRYSVRYVALGTLEAANVPGVAPLAAADSLPGLREIFRSPELRLFEVPAALDAARAAKEWDRTAPAAGGSAISAETAADSALTRAASLRDPSDAVAALASLAQELADAGRWSEVQDALEAGLRRGRELGGSAENRRDLRALRGNLAVVRMRLGKGADAISLLNASLEELNASLRSPAGEAGRPDPETRRELAQTLALLSLAEEKLGRIPEAIQHLEQAAAIYRALGDRNQEQDAEAKLGELRRMIHAGAAVAPRPFAR